MIKIYTGEITRLFSNQIFVFGSNTEGRHGKGAAKVALDKFGAKYGQASGRHGQSYAIITKDLTKKIHPSIPEDFIVDQIRVLYEYARQNKNLEFLVAYTALKPNLNGYSNDELARMFAKFEIPANIIFGAEFAKLVCQYNFSYFLEYANSPT